MSLQNPLPSATPNRMTVYPHEIVATGPTGEVGGQGADEPVDRQPTQTSVPTLRPIFRPVQYLGSKLRVVDAISSLVKDAVPVGARVADLFSGSSVVSQAVANSGYNVTAVDVQRYSAVFAEALLGVGRRSSENIPVDFLLSTVGAPTPLRWSNFATIEDNLVAAGDAEGLRAFERGLPLAWRSGRHLADEDAPLTSFYAASYFGVSQALALDQIWKQIAENRGALSPWARSAALTALMHAASIIVHSAGKHFAQPLRHRDANATFLNSRLLADRSLSVVSAFRSACDRIEKAAPAVSSGHSAVHGEAEQWIENCRPHEVYYLDPPYTAQQYSRFYHLLETIATYSLPKLPAGSAPSSGLYPDGRYKSAFSSKSRAASTLRKLLGKISSLGSTAIVSYSVSERGSNGNARMVTLAELLACCHDAYGYHRVEVISLAHRYRQFNSADNANDRRDDREVLVLCKPA